MLETKRKDKTKRWPSLFFSARVRLSHDSPGGQTQRTPGGRGEGDAWVRWREERGVRRDLRHAEELFGALVGAGTRDGRGGRGSGIQAYGCANRKRVRFRERGVSPAPLCLPTARATGLTLGRRSGWLSSSGHQAVRASLFYFWFSRPRPFDAFSTLPGRSRKFNLAPAARKIFRATLPQSFQQNFPDLRFRGFKGLALGSGETPLGLPPVTPWGGCHNFPVSTEYYSILCNLCRDGKEKGAKSERLKVERVELRRVQEGRRHAKVRRERPGQLPSNQNGGRDILPHRRGCRPLLVPPFLSRSSPSRRRQLDHIGVPHKNGACG